MAVLRQDVEARRRPARRWHRSTINMGTAARSSHRHAVMPPQAASPQVTIRGGGGRDPDGARAVRVLLVLHQRHGLAPGAEVEIRRRPAQGAGGGCGSTGDSGLADRVGSFPARCPLGAKHQKTVTATRRFWGMSYGLHSTARGCR